MKNKLQILGKIKKVNPPDYLYDRIIDRFENRVTISTINLYVVIILLLLKFNIFSYNYFTPDNMFFVDLFNVPISFLEYE